MAKKEKKTVDQTPKLSKSLTDVFESINKKMWFWTIKLTNSVENVKVISTWVPSVDVALGWGIPEWRLIEIYWPESSGKTSFCLQVAKQFQKENYNVAFIDVEQAFSKKHAMNIWIDINKLIYVSAMSAQQSLQIVEDLASTWEVKLIILDSVAALVPQEELDWEMWDTTMWLMARLMWQACRKLTPILAKTWTTVIFINQIRQKIWVMFWSNETVTWGNALKYYSSQRIDVRKKWFLKEDPNNKEKVTGIEMKIKIIKNKIAAPGAEVLSNFHYKWWFDQYENIINALIDLWVIQQSWPSCKIVIDWEEIKTQWKKKMMEKVKNWEIKYDVLYKMLQDATIESETFFNEDQDENEDPVLTQEDFDMIADELEEVED